jgi:hypothetical protein
LEDTGETLSFGMLGARGRFLEEEDEGQKAFKEQAINYN